MRNYEVGSAVTGLPMTVQVDDADAEQLGVKLKDAIKDLAAHCNPDDEAVSKTVAAPKSNAPATTSGAETK